ncbi:hypothetical protein AAFF_G00127620 [Aldrovandia affinis]|uniref:LRRN4 C-terminal-like protein n=1 Tax=Aldrovandia affinis TaxID=143900 RepID=A0AAD7T110_9TELE|nr:hypothetical protein AAFF_G00127620 [Aldrovandia affinis]
MAAVRNQPSLLVLLLLALSSGYTAKRLAEGNGTETLIRPRILNELGLDPSEDYTSYEESTVLLISPPVSPTEGKSQRCEYDPCQDQQRPCVDLSVASDCQCPGLSGPLVLPEAPRFVHVAQEGPEVVVKWCSPASTVSHYQIVVEGREPLVVGELSRKGVLKDLEAGARVCVEAVNAAGVSSPSQYSCMSYEPERDGGLALKAGLIGGALGLLLLLFLVVFLLRRRKARGKSRGRNLSQTSDAGGTLKGQEDDSL